MNTGRKPDNILKLVTSSTQTTPQHPTLTQDVLNTLEAYILLASNNGNLEIQSSNPDHTLSDIYCCISLILRQIESIIMDNDE